VQHGGETAGIDVWKRFAEVARQKLGDAGRWDTHARQLAVGFDTVSEQERESFKRDFKLEHVDLSVFGVFAKVAIEGLPLAPATQTDAKRWAEARLSDRLVKEPRFQTREEVLKLWSGLVDETPLAMHAPAVPSHRTLLERTAGQPAVFWSLAAPVDLSLAEVPAQLLGGGQ